MVLMRLVGDWALRFAALPMLGVPCRDGRWWINEVVEETNRNLEWGKKHSSLRDLLVILDFSRGLFVMWGDVLCCCLIHLPFRKKRKKEKKLSMKYRIILR
jgi:hypothetical protein